MMGISAVAAFAELVEDHVEAVLVQPSLPHDLASAIALKHNLPLIVPSAEFAAAGALMAYAAEPAPVYREAATFVDNILKGRKPADLPFSWRPSLFLRSTSRPRTRLA